VVWSRIQVAFNNVARSITGTRRGDHVKIEDLLAQAGLESAIRMVVKAIAAETWVCFHSDDGRNGASNHVSRLHFSDKRTATAKTTRLAKTGQIEVPLRGATPSSPTRPMCGTGRPRSTRQPLRLRPKRQHRTLQVSPRLSPAGRDSPPAARGVFPAGCGASPAGRGAYPRGCLKSPSRSRALRLHHGLHLHLHQAPFFFPRKKEENCCSHCSRGMSRNSFSCLTYEGEE
jgi:hypothetical protein